MNKNIKLLSLSAVFAFALAGCITAKQTPVEPVDGDDDGDGVLNSVDECPNTPAGAAVDHRGCEILVQFNDTHFAFDSADLNEAAQASLLAGIDKVSSAPITIAGHTDSVGSDKYNLRLSEERANSVASFLMSNGVGADQISVVGYGESMPVADNSTKEGRAQNRRVNITPTN